MIRFRVEGMTCSACSAHVEKAVSKVDGVKSVAVSLLTNSMAVEGQADPQAIIQAVISAGYRAFLDEQNNEQDGSERLIDAETPRLRRRLSLSVCLLLPLMYISMGHVMWGWPLPSFLSDNHLKTAITELILTVAIIAINFRFFSSGFSALIKLAPNMDTLVALGALAAFGYSTVILIMIGRGSAHLHELYFESAAMILTLITLGKMLEAYSKGKTTSALKELMSLSPKTASIEVEGKEVIVGIERVSVGDIFIVRSGDSIPVDGVIVFGHCAVDESALTGESVPTDKSEGDSVSAATINRAGYIRCRATRVGSDTTISQIIKMVSESAASKAPIAKIADRVSGVFVPVVIGIALVTTVVWMLVDRGIGFALARGISVLVISCPCALGLATPVAIMVGNGKAAKNGILFKTAASLEHTGHTKIVAFDKTGTLTHGRPVVTDMITTGDADESMLLSIAYSLEVKSEHPLARAIVERGEEEGKNALAATGINIAPGNGLSAYINGKTAFGGKADFIEKHAHIPTEVTAEAYALAEKGKTPIYFAYDNELLGVIATADTIKEDATEAVYELKELGIEPVMLTGDNVRTGTAIGRLVGIETVICEVLPADKERKIEELKCKGRVAMVGDGINDAPALTSADIGLAIGAGTDVAIDAADIVLSKSRLRDVSAAIRLSRGVLKIIHQNLFWAFFYNVIGIPLAAGVWIPLFGWELNPMFGAAAMSLSSFCVVMNSLRINRIKIYGRKKEDAAMEEKLNIEGMMCAHCEARVKNCLEAIDGVREAIVSHKKGTAIVKLDRDISREQLKQAVEAQGYKVI